MEIFLGYAIAELAFVTFFGLVMGSFATMLSYRLPRDLPIFSFQKADNFSACPQCHKRLGFLDLVPFFSWLFQGGKCRYCHKKIPFDYPLIELATCSLALIAYNKFGLTWSGIVLMALSPVLVSLFVVDWYFKILPNVLNAVFLITGIIFQILNSSDLFFYGVSAIVYPLSMIFIRWIFLKMTGKDGLGFGDIKFFAGAGMWLGLPIFSAYLLLCSLLGVLFGLIHKGLTKEATFPFGPALIMAFLICLYTKETILIFL